MCVHFLCLDLGQDRVRSNGHGMELFETMLS